MGIVYFEALIYAWMVESVEYIMNKAVVTAIQQ